MPVPVVQQNAVFLNIPYDARFHRIYLAYVVGLAQLGLEPRATLLCRDALTESSWPQALQVHLKLGYSRTSALLLCDRSTRVGPTRRAAIVGEFLQGSAWQYLS